LNINEANKIFRKSIIKGFFEPQLVNLDFKKSMQSDLLHVFFDIETGSDYPDGDEWFIVELLFPYTAKLPDSLKGPDFFTTISVDDGKTFWHHRELIRYKYGKSKKLTDALEFLESKYKELHELLKPLQKDLS
jgi:hypothetical protein